MLAAVIAFAAALTSAPTDAQHFDLKCSGTEEIVGVQKAKPWSRQIAVDLSKSASTWDGAETNISAVAFPTKLVFDGESQTSRVSVDRQTGSFDEQDDYAGMKRFVKGRCVSAPFTGVVAPLF